MLTVSAKTILFWRILIVLPRIDPFSLSEAIMTVHDDILTVLLCR